MAPLAIATVRALTLPRITAVADFQLILNDQAAGDGPGDDGLLRTNLAVPAARGGQIQSAVQFTVAVHLTGNHELPRAADVADEHGIGADEGGRGGAAVEKTAFLLAHALLLSALR